MFTIPKLSELRQRILDSLSAGFDAVIDEEGKAALRVQADTQAAEIYQLYLAAAEIQANIFVDTCDLETLLRKGQERLGRLPFSAVAGKYVVKVTGTIGGTINASTTFKSDDDSKNPGVIFILDEAYMLTQNPDYITLRCLTLGEEGKLNVFDTLTSTSPIALVDKSVSVSSEAVQPLSGEEVNVDYREKVRQSYRLEAQGGSPADYRIWCADAQGVLKVYPYATPGETSEMDIYVEATIADSTDGKGTPTPQIITDVENVIEQNPDTTIDVNERGRRPIGAIPNVLPITPKEIKITVTGFQNLDAGVQADLLSAFTTAIANIRPFIAGTDSIAEKDDLIDTNKLIGIITTVRPGAVFTSVSFTVDNAPTTSYIFIAGNIPFLNSTITYN